MLVYPQPPRRADAAPPCHKALPDDHARRLRYVLAGMEDLLTELDLLGQELAAAHLATAMDNIRRRAIG